VEPLSHERTPDAESASAAPDDAVGEGTSLSESEQIVSSRDRKHEVYSLLARYGVVVAFLATIVAFSLARPHTFPTIDNLKSILETAAPAAIVALGLTVPLVMRDFDLSFGSMIGLAGGAAVILQSKHGSSALVAILVVIGLAVLAGSVNGFLVAYLGGSSFIITLAMGTVLTGVEFAFTKQSTIFAGVSHGYAQIAHGSILGLSNIVWIAFVIAILLWVVLDLTELGRYMYAVGGNPEASRLSGVPNRRLRLIGFVIVALGGAVVGILLTSNSGSYTPNFGTSYLLPAYAGAFLGAAVFRLGEFNIPGTVLGVLFLGVIQTGLTMLSLETYIINLVQGTILISAVLLSRLGQQSR
jgi:ribose transport system permease protein